jgi:hypothetical protein
MLMRLADHSRAALQPRRPLPDVSRRLDRDGVEFRTLNRCLGGFSGAAGKQERIFAEFCFRGDLYGSRLNASDEPLGSSGFG